MAQQNCQSLLRFEQAMENNSAHPGSRSQLKLHRWQRRKTRAGAIHGINPAQQ